MSELRLTGLLLLLQFSLHAQDTLKITLAQADSLLVVRNLSLIAFHYEVDKAEAAIVQAGLLNNPELATEWNLHNPQNGEWFDVGNRGQKIFALSQVFRIAGQRSTAVRLAKEEKRLTEFQFLELVRALRYELHVSFYRYHFLNNAINNIRSQLALLKDLIDVYGDQYKKGNISLQELTRLNTTYFTINNQVKDVQQELIRQQETLRTLLAEDRFVLPTPTTVDTVELVGISLAGLIERALENRPEIKTIESLEAQHQLRYTLARKEAVPDLTGGFLFDQTGSFVNNYTAITLGFQIPIFNRNQGQIQAARIGMSQSRVLLQSKQQQIKNEVNTAWSVLGILRKQYDAVGADYEDELNLLSEGLVTNYSKNNISLLEFTDHFESYNANIIQYNQLKADLRKAYEELIYVVGE